MSQVLSLFPFFFDLSAFYSGIVSNLLSSVSSDDLYSVAHDFVNQLNIGAFYSPILEKLDEALHDPRGEVIIFSSSPDFIVGPIAKRLGVSLWYASSYKNYFENQAVENQCLTGKRKAKILSYLKKIGGVRSHTFSDHILDLPFLLLGEEKTVVRPTGRLKKMARKYYWNII
ncbi:haloacid dehalogenase-like hydrolase family protein [Chlamydia ibidis 10-1398/6]|uniref:Haloacid dehalogenase-like hydrolase family protein n=1 Tax=Chlamydia ibidis 10-1398/6 TaxID=1046581 RepID=A0ABP2XDC5_9CHLA|nr:haloacid dehalogenase-like hydrolase family protein [Chlamydia ibidis 10-1398/6]